ncbi:MAG: OB-fold nucleic acid binding domain-containing protein [Candidatus Aenigmarchaeota archaeon]|nr:OB-fold nucleic acid binding domain-containing protein [Candidatus Aenigmarchaeota archaeon]
MYSENDMFEGGPERAPDAQAEPAQQDTRPGRLVAVRVRASDITHGRFFPGSRESMEAGHVITPLGERLSRANLIGTVVDRFVNETGSYASITLDDGTDAVRAKAFGADIRIFDGVKAGDAAVVIGKVKEYQGETYVAAESVRVLRPDESNDESLRKLELLDRLNDQKTAVENLRRAASTMTEDEMREYARRVGMDAEALHVVLEQKDEDYKPRVLEALEKLDEGGGVDVMLLFGTLQLPDAVVERAVDDLLEDGSIFEPSPGRFRAIKG